MPISFHVYNLYNACRFIRLYENPVSQETAEQENKRDEGHTGPDDSEKEFLHTYISSLKERGELFWSALGRENVMSLTTRFPELKLFLSLTDTAPTYTTKVSLSCILWWTPRRKQKIRSMLKTLQQWHISSCVRLNFYLWSKTQAVYTLLPGRSKICCFSVMIK